MLRDLLESRQCFKLVCGAGNEDADEVEKLVAIYAKAGAKYFDLSANVDIIQAAYKGLSRVIPEQERLDYYMNVSVGIKGDPHVSKSQIDAEACKRCGKCFEVCPQEAIVHDDGYHVNDIKCIGCGRCYKSCKFNAIQMISEDKDLNEVLPPLVEEGLASIELHAVSDDEKKIYQQWEDVCNNFDGILSICTDRSHASDVELKKRITNMIARRKPKTVIIQADGAPMSGGKDDYATTLQAIATAQVIQRMNLPVYLLLSGGTNSKSVDLANMCDVNAHGVSIGLFGRNLVREYTKDPNFWIDESLFNKALEKAKTLVDYSLKGLKEIVEREEEIK